LGGNLKIYDQKVTKFRSEQKVEVIFLLLTLKQCFLEVLWLSSPKKVREVFGKLNIF
jgi:hypothetical protein